jgi:hypothetical protein
MHKLSKFGGGSWLSPHLMQLLPHLMQLFGMRQPVYNQHGYLLRLELTD